MNLQPPLVLQQSWFSALHFWGPSALMACMMTNPLFLKLQQLLHYHPINTVFTNIKNMLPVHVIKLHNLTQSQIHTYLILINVYHK